MFGLGFLAPAFLAGLLAVAVPIALHLFRRRTDKVIDFPAAQMLPASPVARQERRRLRDLLLLALRVAALVLLAVSFARPYLAASDAAVGGGTTIVAVDISLSTSAPATWAEVQRRAAAAVAEAPAADLVGLVTFDDRGHLVVAPSADRDEATGGRRRRSPPGAGGTSYAAGVGAAVEALQRRPRPHRRRHRPAATWLAGRRQRRRPRAASSVSVAGGAGRGGQSRGDGGAARRRADGGRPELRLGTALGRRASAGGRRRARPRHGGAGAARGLRCALQRGRCRRAAWPR